VELLPYCREKGAMLVSYRPLARGSLARPGHTVLDEIAELYGKSRAQVALNWLIGQEGVVAIPKSSNPIHLLDNMGALGWRMDPEDARRLAKSFI
jgi:diketogulonate reductase-like aldo/keto reductase